MKVLPEIEISDELDARINEGMKVSELSKKDLIQEALTIGLCHLTNPPAWIEARVLEALSEPGEEITVEEFQRSLDEIAKGR